MSEGDIKFDSFAMFDSDRWMGSDTYHATTGGERRLLAPFFLWQSQHGPILDDAFLLYRIAWADEAEPGAEFLDRIRFTLRKAFKLAKDRTWRNKTSMKLFFRFEKKRLKAIEDGRRGGLTKAKNKKEKELSGLGTLGGGVVGSLVGLYPSPSPSNSSVEERSGEETRKSPRKPKQTALALPDPVLDLAVKRYMIARAMRLHPDLKDASEYGLPGEGTLATVRKHMAYLLSKKHPPELLASLPALTDLPGLCKRADVLLRSGENPHPGQDGKTYGATCHAEVIDSLIAQQDHGLDKRQVEILRTIGTADYVMNRGAFAKGGWS